MLEFKYTIREYNEEQNYIDVDFEGGSWARIILHSALPTNQKELDDLVSQYAGHLRKSLKTDDTFIKKSIGKKNRGTLFDILQVPNMQTNVMSPSEKTENPYQETVEEMETKWVEDIVTKILIDKGLISE